MVIDALTIEENAYSGFSHQAAITFADLAALPAGLTGSFVIGVVAPEDVILRACLVVDTAFAGTGITGLTAQIADPTTATYFGTAPSILSLTNTPVALTSGIVAAGNITLTLTAVGANLNLCTVGQFRVLYSKNSLAKFAKY